MIEKESITQIKSGERFEFGKNWNSYLDSLSNDKITIAESSLKEMLANDNLSGKTFLDIGCGSGLFSLAAKNLKAKVHSFDFDKESVKCTEYLKEKYHPDSNWKIEERSILDSKHISQLPKFDIVYSWGVLHHTGNLMLALENATIPVKSNGILFISIYNDQGAKSRFWLKVKKTYNSNAIGKFFISLSFFSFFILLYFFADILRLKSPLKRYTEYQINRGMSLFHDWKDWIGGLPFEFATPELIFEFYKKRGFQLEKIRATNSSGCNQFVFKKIGTSNKNKNP